MDSLLSSKAQPHEVERPTHTDQEADEGQITSVEEAVCSPADSAPEEQAREEVSEDRPESILCKTTGLEFLTC